MVLGHDPLGASPMKLTVIGASQLSLVVTELVSAGGTSSSHSTVTGPGQVAVGGVVSSTVIVCVQSVVLPQPSVARYVRVMVFGHEPLSTSPTCVTVTGAAQLSLVVTE